MDTIMIDSAGAATSRDDALLAAYTASRLRSPCALIVGGRPWAKVSDTLTPYAEGGELVYESDADLIARAEHLLDSEWDGEQLSYHDDGMQADYICESESELIRLGILLAAGTDDAYSLWCGQTSHAEVRS